MITHLKQIDRIDRLEVRKYGETYFSARTMAKNYAWFYWRIINKDKKGVQDSSEQSRLRLASTTSDTWSKSREPCRQQGILWKK
jgi:hypothetical protein